MLSCCPNLGSCSILPLRESDYCGWLRLPPFLPRTFPPLKTSSPMAKPPTPELLSQYDTAGVKEARCGSTASRQDKLNCTRTCWNASIPLLLVPSTSTKNWRGQFMGRWPLQLSWSHISPPKPTMLWQTTIAEKWFGNSPRWGQHTLAIFSVLYINAQVLVFFLVKSLPVVIHGQNVALFDA